MPRSATAPLIIGLAIILNLVIFAGGLLWAKRQVKRVAAERAEEYRSHFQLAPLPPPGDGVQVLVEDEEGKIGEVQAVHWPHLGWTDARTFLRIEEDVLGWRRHPFQSTEPADLGARLREEVADALAKLTSDDKHP